MKNRLEGGTNDQQQNGLLDGDPYCHYWVLGMQEI